MSYFESEIIQNIVVEIDYLRDFLEHCSTRVKEIDSPENNTDYFHTLYALSDKYLNLYVRVRIDTDTEAKMIQQDIKAGAHTMGMVIGGDPEVYFKSLMKECKRRIVEITGEDLDKEVDLS